MVRGVKGPILPFLGGFAVGGLTGYLVDELMKTGIGGALPPVFATAVSKIKCTDITLGVDLIGPKIYGGGVESNGWEYYLVGYGQGTRLNDDVLISLARQVNSPTVIANCVKLADDAVAVYSSGVLQITMPLNAGATEKTLYPAFAWFYVT